MLGLSQHHPLLLSAILIHAEENFPRTEIVSHGHDGETRLTYAEAARRVRRLASVLDRLSLGSGDIAASIAATTHRHFELFHALPGAGVVLQTVNPRHSLDQIIHAMTLTEVRAVFVDIENIPLAEELQARLPHLGPFIALAAASDLPATSLSGLLAYEDLIEAGDDGFEWPMLDERTASTLCFTSGTTGQPKGALYTHRGTLLSVLSATGGNAWALSQTDTLLCVSPLFHCNGWGTPYSGPMMGARMVLPGGNLSGAALCDLIRHEGVTVANGVPTVWSAILDQCEQDGAGLGRLQRVFTGGSAVGGGMVARLAAYQVRTVPSWGMTETTHATTFAPPGDTAQDPDWVGGIQGRPIFGARVRIVDDAGAILPRDGATPGHLQIRGHWLAQSYFRMADMPLCTPDGWMMTGDIATLTDDNIVRITDRAKDVIKSGGEWISSLRLEEVALGCEAVLAVAVVGVPDPRWGERPVLFAVPRAPGGITAAGLLAHMAGQVPRWWLPEAVHFVDALPCSAQGKILKAALRDRARQLMDDSRA